MLNRKKTYAVKGFDFLPQFFPGRLLCLTRVLAKKEPSNKDVAWLRLKIH